MLPPQQQPRHDAAYQPLVTRDAACRPLITAAFVSSFHLNNLCAAATPTDAKDVTAKT